jgi:acetylornithine/succinyldiaminopimelate/putrescine aminotransferase
MGELMITSSECFNFGIMAGCQAHCPVFERGECTTVAEDPHAFLDLVSDWSAREVGELYPELLNARREEKRNEMSYGKKQSRRAEKPFK